MEPEVTVGGQSFTSRPGIPQVSNTKTQAASWTGVRGKGGLRWGLDTWGLGEVEAGFLDSWELGRQR